MKRFVYVVLLILSASGLSAAASDDQNLSAAEVLVAYETIRPGDRLPIAVKLTVAEGWHTYAKEPGDSGMPPSIDISGIDGLEVSEWRFPPAKAFTDSVGTSYGYEHEVVLFSDLLIPEVIEKDRLIELSVKINWMICRDICVFQQDEQTILVQSGAVSSAPSAEWQSLLKESGWEKRVQTR